MDPTAPPERPPRLTMRQFWRDVADEVFSLDRGLPYTFRRLLTAPGPAIREYVDWRDPRMTRPLRFFIVCVAVVTLVGALQHLGAPPPVVAPPADMPRDAVTVGARAASFVVAFVRDWLLLALLLLVPAITAGTEGAFRDRGHTTAELWVFSLYVLAVCCVLVRVLMLVHWLLPTAPVRVAAALAPMLYYVWVCCGFFSGTRADKAGRAAAALFVILALEFAFLVAVAMLAFCIGMAFGRV